MSAPPTSSGEQITSRRQLVEYLAAGCKPAERWRIGTEHEKFIFRRRDLRPAHYAGPDGIGALLNGLADRFGWQKVQEAGNTIALARDGASVSLEPGGQFELSGAPLDTLAETASEIAGHLDEVRQVAGELGLGMLGLGFSPQWRREDFDWMPKGRYAIMRAYMPKRGRLGHDMMLRTSTVQVNLDFASEADMVRKFRVSLALQPLATALFAASPFLEGRPAGYLSYRSQIWTDVDPDRCGMLPFVFEKGFGFERYVDYLLDVPMYFVYRDGRYIDASGQSFGDFMAGKLPALPDATPGIGDWSDHITTAFPEVRLKRYLEMRGADSGPYTHLCALPALWVGLLYDEAALGAAADLVADWSKADHDYLREAVPRTGLATEFRGRKLAALAGEVVALAAAGLTRRGLGEAKYLVPLQEIATTGRSLADVMLAEYRGAWHESVEPAYERFAL
jgi:glutamate--cysteine ligase